MSLSAGSRLGPCEILSPLGAGGMGEVCRARDLDLPTVSFAISPDGTRILLWQMEPRGDILIADGLAGIAPTRAAPK